MGSYCRERGCQARILWAVTAGGKRMPLNVDPDPSGNVATYRNAQGVYVARVLRAGEHPDAFERVHVPHFATCRPRIERERLAQTVKRANARTPGVVVPISRGARGAAGHARR